MQSINKIISQSISSNLFSLIITAFFATIHVSAHSAPVTIDFEDQPTGSRTDNFTSQGFVFSPKCHYDLLDSYNGTSGRVAAPFGKWLGFDPGGSCGGGTFGDPPNYLGPTGVGFGGEMYVASENGRRFSLNSLVFVTVDSGAFGLDVFSSRGGFASFDWTGGNFVEYSFAGSDWGNLDWLVFSTRSGGAPSGFDNLRLNVLPVPSTLSLLLFGLTLLSTARRFKERTTNPG